MDHTGSMASSPSFQPPVPAFGSRPESAPAAASSAAVGQQDAPRRHRPSLGWSLVLGFFVPLTIGGATFAASMLSQSPSLRADSTGSQGDQDGDGLHDFLEFGLALAPDRVDTDGDGWNDTEEIARQSLPNICGSVPDAQVASVGTHAYMRDGKLHFAACVYRQNGSMANLQLELGMFFSNRWVPLSASSYAGQMTVASVPTNNPGELLIVTDVVLSDAPLIRTGATSLYAILRIGNQIVSADATNLVLRGKTPLEMVTPREVSPLAQAQLGTGLLYRPLGGTQVPPTWTAGQLCFQSLDAVGSNGAVVTQEVTSATCVEGWDGYCDSGSCSSSVGTTVNVIDAGALIGG